MQRALAYYRTGTEKEKSAANFAINRAAYTLTGKRGTNTGKSYIFTGKRGASTENSFSDLAVYLSWFTSESLAGILLKAFRSQDRQTALGKALTEQSRNLTKLVSVGRRYGSNPSNRSSTLTRARWEISFGDAGSFPADNDFEKSAQRSVVSSGEIVRYSC